MSFSLVYQAQIVSRLHGRFQPGLIKISAKTRMKFRPGVKRLGLKKPYVASLRNLKCCLCLLFDLYETVAAFKSKTDKTDLYDSFRNLESLEENF